MWRLKSGNWLDLKLSGEGGGRTVVCGTGEGRTHNMFVSARMGEVVYGFSMSETSQNTDLEVAISVLMNLTNRL